MIYQYDMNLIKMWSGEIKLKQVMFGKFKRKKENKNFACAEFQCTYIEWKIFNLRKHGGK